MTTQQQDINLGSLIVLGFLAGTAPTPSSSLPPYTQSIVHSYVPSIRSHRGTKVVFPVLQPMRVSEEQVCTDLRLQKLVFTFLHLRFTVHVVPPLGAAALLFYYRLLPRPLCQILAPTWRTASEKWEALNQHT